MWCTGSSKDHPAEDHSRKRILHSSRDRPGKISVSGSREYHFRATDPGGAGRLDLTPLPVRRLLPKVVSEIDEQGLLTMVSYCQLLDQFTGLRVYRLRSHVRKSVADIGQAELDEIDVGVALRDDEKPVIFPIEAKNERRRQVRTWDALH